MIYARLGLLVILALGAGCASDTAAEAPAQSPSHASAQSSAQAGGAQACGPREFDIYFGSWESALTAPASAQIAAIQDTLAGCRIDRVRIVGMAGAPGDEAENRRVSQERAAAIAAALEAGGWTRSAFELDAIGEDGAMVGDMEQPMRRRARVSIEAFAP